MLIWVRPIASAIVTGMSRIASRLALPVSGVGSADNASRAAGVARSPACSAIAACQSPPPSPVMLPFIALLSAVCAERIAVRSNHGQHLEREVAARAAEFRAKHWATLNRRHHAVGQVDRNDVARFEPHLLPQ